MIEQAGWYAVALSNGLEAGTSAGTRLFGNEMVVWRDTAGAAHVWEDRCPHRGMRLSFGFVRGNHIACLYHGWQYDEAGLCRYIPAHPKLEVPDSIRVATYPSIETSGLLWVWHGAAESVSAAPVDIETTPVRSLYIDAPAASVASQLPGHGFELGGDGLYRTHAVESAVLVALQPFTATRSALHVLAEGDGKSLTGLALWAERLRDALEAASLAEVA